MHCTTFQHTQGHMQGIMSVETTPNYTTLHYTTLYNSSLQYTTLPKCVTCYMSRVTCHVSHVTCHVSHVIFFFFLFFLFFLTKWWSSSVEGLLSTGPTPSSLVMLYILWPRNYLMYIYPYLLSLTKLTAYSNIWCKDLLAGGYNSQNLNHDPWPLHTVSSKRFLRTSSSPHMTLPNDKYDAPKEVCGERKLFDCPLKKWGQKQISDVRALTLCS